ncbi:hypothetical protein [Ruania albidiflava]|uniref:hypothetical protein n=1 Tax=Ruania albidiflava TaxID=366586 RepID=UPI0023F0C116|nr:hypothetical protein [Ruania albidiflava]
MVIIASSRSISAWTTGATCGSWISPTTSARSVSSRRVSSPMLRPCTRAARAAAFSRSPTHSGHVPERVKAAIVARFFSERWSEVCR